MSYCKVCGKELSKKKYQFCKLHHVPSRFGGRKHTEASRKKISDTFKRNQALGKHKPQYVRPKGICVDCGKVISNPYSKRCMSDAQRFVQANKSKNIWGLCCLFCSRPLSRAAVVGLCRHCITQWDEWRKKVSTRARAKVASGKHHWGTGDATPLNHKVRECSEMRRWIDAVFARDDYTCQMCGVRGGTLTADHIKMFAQIMRENRIATFGEALACAELWDINNGRTLCRPCHKKTETWGSGGRKLLKELQLI